MTKPQFGVNKYSRTMNKTKTKPARLIVAASEQDPDILYATKFWAPDPFIFLQRNGKRTLVLSDLEIDRGRKQADADEFVMFSELEREVQGNSKKTPPYEKVLAHFLRKRGVRSAVVPANFPLRYAEELGANNIRVRATDGLYWPEREAKSDKEIDMMRRALRGRASEAQRKLWETVKAGQALALRRIKAGVDGMAIHKAIQQFFTSRGFPTEVRNGRRVGFFHGTGHGLGLEIHEHPRLQKVTLKDRQVLTVEPGLYYPGLGGTRLEDVILVTKTGCRILSRFPKQLEI